MVNGAVKALLYKGTIRILERERSWSSLFCPEIRSIESSGFDQRWCRDGARIRGLPFEVLARRARKAEERSLTQERR
jgi:argininosuccinate synthase